ncbi:MAG: ABC transporter permease [Roseburia sp.]
MRLVSMIRNDVKFQVRYGFYLIYAIICIFYIGILVALPENIRKTVAIILIYSDPAALGLFLMGAMILLEKSQRVLHTLAVSPVRVEEYVLAKTVSMAFTSTIIAGVLAVAAGMEQWIFTALSAGMTSVLFTLLGIALASKITTLNQFIIITTPFEILMFVPPLFYLFGKQGEVMRLIPPNICMGFLMKVHWNYWGEGGILIVTIGLLFLWAVIATKNAWRKQVH